MNKEQIVAIIQRGYFTDGDLADALLTELANVSEPVGTVVNKEGFLYHGQLDSKSAQLPDRSQLFTHPLPQPDLVDENERKTWALLMNADIKQLREQLSAAQADNEQLVKALEAYANPDNWLVDEEGIYQRVWKEPDSATPEAYDGHSIADKAITAHKVRKDKA